MAEGDDISSAVAQVAASDPEIQAAVRSLAVLAVRKTHHFLVNGSPQVQMQILRSFIPALIREMNRGEEGDGHDDLRQEFESLRQEMLKGVEGAD